MRFPLLVLGRHLNMIDDEITSQKTNRTPNCISRSDDGVAGCVVLATGRPKLVEPTGPPLGLLIVPLFYQGKPGDEKM
jgi:hypothetical protein